MAARTASEAKAGGPLTGQSGVNSVFRRRPIIRRSVSQSRLIAGPKQSRIIGSGAAKK